MAKIEFIQGIQCKQCGHMVADLNIYTSELCQECGTRILNIDLPSRTCEATNNARCIIIKATRRLLRPDIYEFVREI